MNAIATYLGVITTFAAVAVASYQSRTTKKLKLRLNYSVTIINTANREILIDDWPILRQDITNGRYKMMTELQ